MKTTPLPSRWKILAILAGFALCPALPAQADSIKDLAPAPAAGRPPSGITLAQQKIDARDYRGAMPILSALINANPRDADALNLMGFSLRKSGDTARALEYYNSALALMPRHLGANEYLGELYVELGQLDKAKERLAVLKAACGDNCEQTRDLAEALSKAERKK